MSDRSMLFEDFLRLSMNEQFDFNPVWAANVFRWRRENDERFRDSDLTFPCPFGCDGDDPECPCQTTPLGGDTCP